MTGGLIDPTSLQWDEVDESYTFLVFPLIRV